MALRRLVGCAFVIGLVQVASPVVAHAQPPAAAEPPIPAAPEGVAPVASPAPPPPPVQKPDATKAVAVEFTSLRLLREKGVISQAEYDSALRDLGETSGMRAGEGNSFVLGKWATTIYGFVEGDAIYDTTQSLNEIAGNTQIAKPATLGGSHDRLQFSVRNSRVGLRLKAPEVGDVRATGQAEFDFFGPTLPFGGTNPGTEAAVFNNPSLRIRHMNLKLETPIVDVLIGQYWVLYGWQAMYLPATVEVQGIPGEIFSRQMQIRVSKTIKTSEVTVEAAIAAVRPPQRNSAVPAGQGGLRVAVNRWTAPQTRNIAGTTIEPLSVAVTGDVRNFRLPELSAEPTKDYTRWGTSLAVDTFIPVIPGTKDTKGNSLALNGEVSTGFGSADMYTSMTGGVSNPALANPKGVSPAPEYTPDIDAGLAVYDSTGQLRLVQWTGFVVGGQYYLPGSGSIFLSGNYARTQSNNTQSLGAAAKTRHSEDWFDVNVFWDVTPAVRLGIEYANFKDTYNDGSTATNERGQLTGMFLF